MLLNTDPAVLLIGGLALAIVAAAAVLVATIIRANRKK